MNEHIFTRVKQRPGPTTEPETALNFLARGERPEIVEIRQWMENWYEVFPVGSRKDLRKRFQSKDIGEFTSTYFELQVFALLSRLNCDLEVHPRFAGTEGTVDFRVTHGKETFYVEATVCGFGQGNLRSSTNEEDAVRKIRENIRELHSDIWLSAEGELNTALSKERVCAPFQGLLNQYTPDDVRTLCTEPRLTQPQQRGELSASIAEGNWRLYGHLAPPIASNSQGQVHGPARGGAVDSGKEPLKKALRNKAHDWKEKKLEEEIFVIMLNACHSEFFWEDEREAIFGNRDLPSDQAAFVDTLREVNGVVVFDHAVLGSERGTRVKLYRNGSMPIPECLEFLVCERHLGDLLGLGDGLVWGDLHVL